MFQVDIGLTVENGKQRYDHMFDIRTPQRTYYLAADSDEEMNAWAKMVCNACGFKAEQEDPAEEIGNATRFLLCSPNFALKLKF